MEVAYARRRLALPPMLLRGGAVVWLLLLVVLPAPLAARFFLAAPLVLVPLLLSALPDRPLVGGLGSRELAAWSLVAAGLLGGAFSLDPGLTAGMLAIPWIGVVGLVGLTALRHGLPSLPGLFLPRRARDLATDGALAMLAVAALFLLTDRLGVRLLGFGPPYTLLGAVHYTFAGFGLLAIVAVLARQPAMRHWLAAAAVIVGMSATAAGMITGSPTVNWLGVLVLAVGALATVWSLVTEARDPEGRGVRRVRSFALVAAAAALLVGLSLGVVSATASTFGFAFLGLDAMVRTHGLLNAVALIVASLALGGGGGPEQR